MFYSALLDKWPCFASLLSRSASWQWLTSPQPVFPSFYPWHPWHPFLLLFLWQSIISKTWWVDSVFPSFYIHPWHPFPSHPTLSFLPWFSVSSLAVNYIEDMISWFWFRLFLYSHPLAPLSIRLEPPLSCAWPSYFHFDLEDSGEGFSFSFSC